MRPQKTRHIDSPPPWERYLPEGGQQTAELTLGLDMYEALRLVDAEGLPQEAAAARMGVSTPTVCRLLGEARRRVATALRDGAARWRTRTRRRVAAWARHAAARRSSNGGSGRRGSSPPGADGAARRGG